MKPLLLILLLACTASARPFHSKPVPKPVAPVVEAAKPTPEAPVEAPEPPKPVVPAEEPISKEAVSATLTHISELAKEQQTQLKEAQKTIDGLSGDLVGAKGSLKEATANVESLNGQIINLTKDRNAQAEAKDTAQRAAEYWHQKDSEAVAKLWWWRRWGWLTGILGILILVGAIVFKFTAWGAKTAAPIIAGIAKI